jgi:hypothetical protein
VSIEIFIRDIEVGDAIRWLERRLGKLLEADTSDGVQYLRVDGGYIRVTVTPHMEDGPFLSLYLKGPDLPWRSSEELAVPCAQELGRTVRWNDERTNGWMEKSDNLPSTPIDSLD